MLDPMLMQKLFSQGARPGMQFPGTPPTNPFDNPSNLINQRANTLQLAGEAAGNPQMGKGMGQGMQANPMMMMQMANMLGGQGGGGGMQQQQQINQQVLDQIRQQAMMRRK